MIKERKRYDNEFKRHAIELVRCSDKNVAQIARELGVKQNTIHNWLKKSGTNNEREIITDSEITKLRRELANTREERDILKKAIAIFSKQPGKNMTL